MIWFSRFRGNDKEGNLPLRPLQRGTMMDSRSVSGMTSASEFYLHENKKIKISALFLIITKLLDRLNE